MHYFYMDIIMKKILITLCLSLLIIFSAAAENKPGISFDDMPDETVLASVGKYNITMYDLKVYIVGYKTIHSWTLEAFDNILSALMLDLLYQCACEDENLTVSEEEVGLYAENFFTERSIDFHNPDEILGYFNTHDPYYDIDDFLLKSQYFLTKIKYLSAHDAIETFRTSMIFLSTKKMKKDEKAEVYKQAMKITNDILYGQISFPDAVQKYSQDAETKATNGKLFAELTKDHRLKKEFDKKTFGKIFQSGLFFPVLLEDKDGYYIIMNTDCRFDDEGKAIAAISQQLMKKYKFERKVVFQEIGY